MKSKTLIILILFLTVCRLYGHDISDSLYMKLNLLKGEEKASVLYQIAMLQIDTYPDSALHYLESAELIIGDNENSEILPEVLVNIGLIFSWKDEFERSLFYTRHAFELFQDRGNIDQVGYTALKMGNIYFHLGDYSRAMEYYLESMDAYEQTENKSRIAHIHNNLGTISHETGDLENAELQYRESLRLYREVDDRVRTLKVLNNLGTLFYDKKAYDSALVYLNDVLIFSESDTLDNNYLISSACNNLALVYHDMGEPDAGMVYLYRSLSKAREISNTYNIVSAYINLGSFHSELGNFDSAAYYLETGLALIDTTGYQTLKLELLKETSRMYAAKNDFRRAYFWGCKADTLDKMIFNQDMSRKLANLRVGYEQDFQNSEIDRLKNERLNQLKLAYAYLISIIVTIILIVIIAINLRAKRSANKQLKDKNNQLTETIQRLKDSEEELKNLNQSKDRLFSIVAHDLRNPVAAISGFTELLHDNFDQLDTETQKEYLLQIMQGTQRMQNLLENLLIWARSQMKAVNFEPEKINVKELVADSIKQVAANLENKKLKYSTEINQDIYVYGDYSMILTVVRNILMNAVKFSFPGGNIIIRAFPENGQCVISIKDEGIGIQSEIQGKIFSGDSFFSTPGTSGEPGSGLGMKISREFMEKNNGEIGVKSEPGKGTTFYIKLPRIE